MFGWGKKRVDAAQLNARNPLCAEAFHPIFDSTFAGERGFSDQFIFKLTNDQISKLYEASNLAEQKMTVQHVHVAEGGQAIVGNVSAPAPGVGANEKVEGRPHALAYAPGVEMPREIEAERLPVPRARRSGA